MSIVVRLKTTAFTARTWQRILGFVALGLLVWSGYEGWAQSRVAAGARTSLAPRGLLDLQLVPDATTARALIADWHCESYNDQHRRATKSAENPNRCEVAFDGLDADFRFILVYALGWSITILWAAWVCWTPKSGLGLLGLVVGAALADVCENHLLGHQLGGFEALPLSGLLHAWTPDFVETFAQAHAVSVTRAFAMFKFVALSSGVLGALALVGGAWVSRAAEARALAEKPVTTPDPANPDSASAADAGALPPPPPSPPPPTSFKTLINAENAGIFDAYKDTRTPDHPILDVKSASGEPWVQFRAADIIGLAFSGGGIRSATFNLGLLEGLHRLGLLKLFDYLSTVSGGGYVGSFWSAWVAKKTQETEAHDAPLFPVAGVAGGYVDSNEERHLREFSRFLVPRVGFFEVETWTGVVAILAGLLPALLMALCVIGVALVMWLGLTFPLASPSPWGPLPIVGLLTVVVLWLVEWLYRKRTLRVLHDLPDEQRQLEERESAVQIRYIAISCFAVLLVMGALYVLGLRASDNQVYRFVETSPSTTEWQSLGRPRGYAQWWTLTGIAVTQNAWIVSPTLFDYSLAWLLTAALMVVARLLYAIWPGLCVRSTLAAFDRVLMRLVALAAMWAGCALVWHLAINIAHLSRVTVSAMLSAGLFAALRNWIGVALRRSPGGGVLDRLKPQLPQVLAYVTLILAAGGTGNLLIKLAGPDWITWWALASGMGLVLVVGLFINPAEFGLHAFYRDRISRAYAGASNSPGGEHSKPRYNRATEPKVGDDPKLADLVAHPLHLVCCAANDLTGDALETLSRGARSAVLSKYGFALGDCVTGPQGLTLGAAITASAAAFNSNMGKISLDVGPAVAFLMTALNLRLGLWLRHPSANPERPRRWPGLLLYREMFGRTEASGIIDGAVPLMMRDIHLSDGGHFENLALYELVRRHCRYILVSDCGADPEVAFDDLGNALRRVREDFGVEVSLDVSPLRPRPDGTSRQHIALGTIHYSETDRGILLYVKPTLTGDESPDVLQYKTRNGAFPHEGTSDQFYDEAQWESYRRLGMHVADCVFEFVTPPSDPRDQRTRPLVTADWVFGEAVHRWGETPPGLADKVLAMTARFSDLERDLRESGTALIAEVFPELTRPQLRMTEQEWKEFEKLPVDKQRELTAQPPSHAVTTTPVDLLILLRAMQSMEDAWIACELDKWWSHPLNMGWTNMFARWATSPSFRHWWPVFAPMYSPGFRAFVDQRFPVRTRLEPDRRFGVPQKGEVQALGKDDNSGLAAVWWRTRSSQPEGWTNAALWDGRTLYQNLLDLPNPGGELTRIQVGIVAVVEMETAVGWTSDDFFVPPSLWGTGIGWYFLRGLLMHFKAQKPPEAPAVPQTGTAPQTKIDPNLGGQPTALAVAESRFKDCYVVVKAPHTQDRNQVALEDRQSFIEQYRKMGFRQRTAEEMDKDAGAKQAFAFAAAFLGFDEQARGCGDTLWQLTFATWDVSSATADPKKTEKQDLTIGA